MPWEANALIEVRVLYIANLQKCMNVFHYSVSGDTTGFSKFSMQEAFATLNASPGNGTWSFEFASVMSDAVFVDRVQVQQVFPQRLRVTEIDVNVQGTRIGIMRAQNVQASITKLGQIADRHNQGGMRIGGIREADYQTGLITADYKTALTTLVGDLAEVRTDGLSPAQYHPAIANKTQVPGSDPPKFVFSGSSPVFQWVVENELRTMSRRTVGRGE